MLCEPALSVSLHNQERTDGGEGQCRGNPIARGRPSDQSQHGQDHQTDATNPQHDGDSTTRGIDVCGRLLGKERAHERIGSITVRVVMDPDLGTNRSALRPALSIDGGRDTVRRGISNRQPRKWRELLRFLFWPDS